MATYLAICQKVARESGTIQGTQPAAVTGQTGRLLKVVNWVADSWTMIQNLHSAWRWMRAEFPATALTTSGAARYTGASWSITNLAEWITEPRTVSVYLNATGVSDENEIRFIEDFNEWLRLYARGTQTNNRPTNYSISPANEFCLGPVPDATYRLNGLYRKTPQTLSASGDIPECPARFHDIIAWRALQLMVEHDEAPPQVLVTANGKYRELLDGLERDQLSRITVGGGPLA